MAVPTQKVLHRPILEILDAANTEMARKQISESLTTRFSLTEADLKEEVPSKTQTRFGNRVYWALSYLTRAGLLHSETPGRFQIFTPGREFLSQHVGDIESKQLNELIKAKRQRSIADDLAVDQTGAGVGIPDPVDSIGIDSDDATPDEQIALSYQELISKLNDDLLDSIMRISYQRFEYLALDLLEKMGYGKPTHTGRSGDHGVDGVIEQDSLGLDKICVQAKQWKIDATVPEQEIRNFAGSLDMEGATKGVFITTARFSASAKEAARIISGGNKFLRLIECDELLTLLIEHEVGVLTVYVVKTLDENYFAEDV